MVSPTVAEYLRNVAEWLMDGANAEDEYEDNRDAIWAKMNQHERDDANQIVQEVFGQWL